VKKLVTMEEIAQYAFMAFVAIAVIAGLAVGFLAYDAQDWTAASVADANVCHADHVNLRYHSRTRKHNHKGS